MTTMNPVLANLLQRYPELDICRDSIAMAHDILVSTFKNKGKLLICGNGGSASDSDHIVTELMKGFENLRPMDDAMKQRLTDLKSDSAAILASKLQRGLPTISLTAHTPLITAVSNDLGEDMIFAQQVYGYGQAGDTLIGISTSGTSRNVLLAMDVAKALDMKTIGLTGESGGKMRTMCDVAICVPRQRTLEVQELHLPIYHALCIMLENEFFGDRG